MKLRKLWTILFATMLFAACGGEDHPTNPPYDQLPSDAFSLSITQTAAKQTSLVLIIKTTGAVSYGYIIEPHKTPASEYTAAEIFANGTIGSCAPSGTTTFTIENLKDNQLYDIYLCAKGGGELYTDVITTSLTTKPLPEFTITHKGYTQIKAAVRLPNSVAESSVVKWMACDLATYNYNGGNANMDGMLALNEQIYANYFTTGYDFDISNENSSFTINGTTYRRYEELQPGQPMILLMGEYGAGNHAEYGAGYYTPLFTNNGYLRKEAITTLMPEELSAAPTLRVNVTSSGKGSITISMPTDATSFYYLIVNNKQYEDILALLDGKTEYMQWFVSSAFASKHYNSTRGVGKSIVIKPETLNLNNEDEYHLLVTAWGADGLKQSFASQSFIRPPAAPEKATNTIIAHRGGSKEAGKAMHPDNSIASLKYAMSLGCYASEADIYWTKDNQIIVAHADSNCKINGLYPWENTLATIQAKGKLSNGETIPSLEDYLRAAMVNGSCTKVCLDIKAITSPSARDADAVKACQRACEIIVEMEAQAWCEFICSGRSGIVKNCAQYANKAGIDIGAMGDNSASEYKGWGYTWHNRNEDYGLSESQINSYLNSGMEVSVYTIDNDSEFANIQSYYKKLRGITTNYPKWMLSKF